MNGRETTPKPTDDGGVIPHLAVAIVCKSNEATIRRTLESVHGLAAEIVAVDSGSTDKTIEILESFGATVYREAWQGHVKTKQRAMDLCTKEWVLTLDSDENLEADLRASVRAAMATSPTSVHGFAINRKVFYQGRLLHHAFQPEWRVRLVRKGHARWEGIDPHDGLVMTDGTAAAKLAGVCRHDSFVTYEDQLRKQVGYGKLGAAGFVKNGSRGSYVRLLTSPIGAFAKQMIIKQAWRDGWAGWLAAASAANQALVKHMLIIEQSRLKGEQRDWG